MRKKKMAKDANKIGNTTWEPMWNALAHFQYRSCTRATFKNVAVDFRRLVAVDPLISMALFKFIRRMASAPKASKANDTPALTIPPRFGPVKRPFVDCVCGTAKPPFSVKSKGASGKLQSAKPSLFRIFFHMYLTMANLTRDKKTNMKQPAK